VKNILISKWKFIINSRYIYYKENKEEYIKLINIILLKIALDELLENLE
jgi:membrane protein CcdC involved in cytochrome C biogenesis